MNLLINRDHQKLDVFYISTLIRLLVQDQNIHVHVRPLFLAYFWLGVLTTVYLASVVTGPWDEKRSKSRSGSIRLDNEMEIREEQSIASLLTVRDETK